MIFNKINRQLRKINRKRKRAHISTAEGIMLGLMVTLTAVSSTVTASDIIANTEPVVVTELSSVDDSLSEEPELMDDEELMVVFTISSLISSWYNSIDDGACVLSDNRDLWRKKQ